MIEIILIIILIVSLAFVAGYSIGYNLEAVIASLFLLFTVLVLFTHKIIKTETAYALELYQQNKPITQHQSKLVLGHESYSNDKPIVLKKDSQ